MATITGDHEGGTGLEGIGQDGVVGSVTADRGHVAGSSRHLVREIDEEGFDLPPLHGVEAERGGEHPAELVDDDRREQQAEPTGDGFVDDSARGAGGDQRRNEHVGVADDSGLHVLSARTASTSNLGVLRAQATLLSGLTSRPLEPGEPLERDTLARNGTFEVWPTVIAR